MDGPGIYIYNISIFSKDTEGIASFLGEVKHAKLLFRTAGRGAKRAKQAGCLASWKPFKSFACAMEAYSDADPYPVLSLAVSMANCPSLCRLGSKGLGEVQCCIGLFWRRTDSTSGAFT